MYIFDSSTCGLLRKMSPDYVSNTGAGATTVGSVVDAKIKSRTDVRKRDVRCGSVADLCYVSRDEVLVVSFSTGTIKIFGASYRSLQVEYNRKFPIEDFVQAGFTGLWGSSVVGGKAPMVPLMLRECSYPSKIQPNMVPILGPKHDRRNTSAHTHTEAGGMHKRSQSMSQVPSRKGSKVGKSEELFDNHNSAANLLYRNDEYQLNTDRSHRKAVAGLHGQSAGTLGHNTAQSRNTKSSSGLTAKPNHNNSNPSLRTGDMKQTTKMHSKKRNESKEKKSKTIVGSKLEGDKGCDVTVISLCMSEEFNLMATCSDDGSVRVFDYLDLRLLSVHAAPKLMKKSVQNTFITSESPDILGADSSSLYCVMISFVPRCALLIGGDNVGRLHAWSVRPMTPQWVFSWPGVY